MTDLLPSSVFGLSLFILGAAFLMDFLIGDPRWLPHPVRQMGRMIDQTEKCLRPHLMTPAQERWGGVVLVVVVVGMTILAVWLVMTAALALDRSALPGVAFLTTVFFVYLTATTIALRELIGKTAQVAKLVERGNLEQARTELALIVGRDTGDLSPRQIHRALIETLGENLSDGVIAPLFYLALGGLPTALAYKAINTMDSMVGYKNERYLHFGRAAARLDDLVNYLPARITAGLIALSAGLLARNPAAASAAVETMRADGRKHASPNAGLPEAAMAGALGVCLGGPAAYGGIRVDKPYLGSDRIADYPAAVGQARKIVVLSSLIFVFVVGAVLFMVN